MDDPLKRYELFGWDYARHSPVGEEELAWYAGHARATGGADGTEKITCFVCGAPS